MPNIIIIGEPSNPQVELVTEKLERGFADIHYLDLSKFSDTASVQWDPAKNSGALEINEVTLPFNRIYSVYWQNANPLNLPISRDMLSALSPFFHNASIRWVNSVDAINYHQNKPRQLAHAKQLGATIPATFIGNSVDAAFAFATEYPEIIVKPVHGGMLTRELAYQERTPERIAQLLKDGPVTLQTNIGGSHIRTYVLGPHVLSATIHSDYLDYRDDRGATATELLLPKEETELARRICRGFGMVWCAIDWKYYRGKYVFLEANPCPQFAHFEAVTQYPISGCIANMLLDYRSL
jgi:hypothetical protein